MVLAETELESVNSTMEAAQLAARNEVLEEAVLAQRPKDADDAIKAAIRRGAILPKDEALQAKWRKCCIENPDMLTALNAKNGSPALKARRLTIGPVRIERESSAAVLQAFGNERDPIKRAHIYRSEIRKRPDEGDDMPLQAATITPGTLSGTLVTQRVELILID